MKQSRRKNVSKRNRRRTGGEGGASGYGVRIFGFNQQPVSEFNNVVKTTITGGEKLYSRFFNNKKRSRQRTHKRKR